MSVKDCKVRITNTVYFPTLRKREPFILNAFDSATSVARVLCPWYNCDITLFFREKKDMEKEILLMKISQIFLWDEIQCCNLLSSSFVRRQIWLSLHKNKIITDNMFSSLYFFFTQKFDNRTRNIPSGIASVSSRIVSLTSHRLTHCRIEWSDKGSTWCTIRIIRIVNISCKYRWVSIPL